MHPDPLFHVNDTDLLLSLVRMRPFAMVIAVEGGDPFVEHTPVHGQKLDDSVRFRFCLDQNSPTSKAIRNAGSVLIVFTGPDAYISPEWLGEPGSLPYWNYLSAEARGTCIELESQDVLATFKEVSSRFDEDLTLPDDVQDAPSTCVSKLDQITGFEMVASSFVGVRKLSQDKKRHARAEAGEKLALSGGDRAIAAMMMNQQGE